MSKDDCCSKEGARRARSCIKSVKRLCGEEIIDGVVLCFRRESPTRVVESTGLVVAEIGRGEESLVDAEFSDLGRLPDLGWERGRSQSDRVALPVELMDKDGDSADAELGTRGEFDESSLSMLLIYHCLDQ